MLKVLIIKLEPRRTKTPAHAARKKKRQIEFRMSVPV